MPSRPIPELKAAYFDAFSAREPKHPPRMDPEGQGSTRKGIHIKGAIPAEIMGRIEQGGGPSVGCAARPGVKGGFRETRVVFRIFLPR